MLRRAVEVVHDGALSVSAYLSVICIVVAFVAVLLIFMALTMVYVITSYLYRKAVRMTRATYKLFAKGATRLRRKRRVCMVEEIRRANGVTVTFVSKECSLKGFGERLVKVRG